MCRRNHLLGAMLFTLGLGLLLANLFASSFVAVLLGILALIFSWILCKRC